MSNRILAVCACVILLTVPVAALAQGMSGNWSANVFGTRVNAQVNVQGKQVSGVAYVYSMFGKKDTYHFYGGVQGNNVYARHNDGHVFQGTISGPGRVSGVLTTKHGHKIPVTAQRN